MHAAPETIVYTVAFTLTDRYWRDPRPLTIPDDPQRIGQAMAYTFASYDDASEFAAHVSDLYGFPAEAVVDRVTTYDDAIGALVEAIGPSPED